MEKSRQSVAMMKRWVTWGGVSRLVKLLLILIVIYFSLTILQSKRPVIPLAGDLLLRGFSDRNLSNSTSAQPHPSRGAVGHWWGSKGVCYIPLWHFSIIKIWDKKGKISNKMGKIYYSNGKIWDQKDKI